LVEGGGKSDAGQQVSDLLVGQAGAAEPQVRVNPVGEQDGVLGDQSDPAAQSEHVHLR
jgi:hypothetical protein